MKILHVYHIYPALFGGASTVVYQTTKELNKLGNNVDVLTTEAYFTGEDLHEHEGNLYRFPLISKRLSKKNLIIPKMNFVLWIKQRLKTYNCVHLHGHRNIYAPVISYYAKKYDVPYVLQVHGAFRNVSSKQRMKKIYDRLCGYKMFRDASMLVALNHAEAEQYKHVGIPKEKIAIIPNGIDVTEYVNLPSKNSFKSKFSISENKKVILYLGRIHSTKGIKFLVEAYTYLTKKLDYKNAVLLIAGPDDGYLNDANFLVNSLGVSKAVFFTGPLSETDKISAYVDSNIVVNVEPINVYGIVPLEAAACSTPVIVSETNAISKVVLQGNFGLAVKYGNVKQLAIIMRKMLNDYEYLEEMGRKGREYIFENYDWRKIVLKLENVYKEIVYIKQC